MWTLMKSSSGATFSGMKPDRWPQVGFHGKRPTVIRWSLSRSRIAADSCLIQARTISSRGRPRTSSDPLDVIVVADQLPRIPVTGLLVAATGEWLVHQVVTEEGGTLGTPACNGIPETSLHRP